jgi:molecular chaperone DnaK (HSP70)
MVEVQRLTGCRPQDVCGLTPGCIDRSGDVWVAAKEAARFQTVRDNQRNVLVEVVEGGDARGKHATRIGKFVIYDLPRGLPAGTPVDVYFSYDRDGIIEVEALMPKTGSKASIRIERVSGMSPKEREGWRDRAGALLETLGLD